VRTFAHSAASVRLGIYLDLQGFGLFEIGLFRAIGSAGAVFWGLVAGLLGDLMGRRRLLIVMAFLRHGGLPHTQYTPAGSTRVFGAGRACHPSVGRIRLIRYAAFLPPTRP
jgi:MFS family permease